MSYHESENRRKKLLKNGLSVYGLQKKPIKTPVILRYQRYLLNKLNNALDFCKIAYIIAKRLSEIKEEVNNESKRQT